MIGFQNSFYLAVHATATSAQLPMKNLNGEFQQLVSDSDLTESTGMIEKLIN